MNNPVCPGTIAVADEVLNIDVLGTLTTIYSQPCLNKWISVEPDLAEDYQNTIRLYDTFRNFVINNSFIQ